RGRARVLQEALDGSPDRLLDGLADPAVHEALDLCLACKGCARDCPTGVDMASYKAEALHQTYRGRRRPRSHYALGWLPALVRKAPARGPRGVLGRLMKTGPVSRVAALVAGTDPRRSLPALAPRTARSLLASAATEATAVDVWLW